MISPLRTMPARKATGSIPATPGREATPLPSLSEAGIGFSPIRPAEWIEDIWISPVMAATPSRTACRKPDEIVTARIMTKKLTAIETAAMFP